MATNEGVVLTEVSERIGTITLNRPEARNALNSEILEALPHAIEDLDADDEVDVLVLTGTDPAFCAGLDLRELGDGGRNLGGGDSGGDRGPFPERTKPLIGAVNDDNLAASNSASRIENASNGRSSLLAVTRTSLKFQVRHSSVLVRPGLVPSSARPRPAASPSRSQPYHHR